MSYQQDRHNKIEKVRKDAIDASLRPLGYDFFWVGCQSRTYGWAKPFVKESRARAYIKRMQQRYPICWAMARNGVLVDGTDYEPK